MASFDGVDLDPEAPRAGRHASVYRSDMTDEHPRRDTPPKHRADGVK